VFIELSVDKTLVVDISPCGWLDVWTVEGKEGKQAERNHPPTRTARLSSDTYIALIDGPG